MALQLITSQDDTKYLSNVQLGSRSKTARNSNYYCTVRNGAWIKDIAYNLSGELLQEFFGLWSMIEASHFNINK